MTSEVASATSDIPTLSATTTATAIATVTPTTLVVVGGTATASTGFGGNATSTAGGPEFTGAANVLGRGKEMSVLGLMVFVVGGLVL